MHLVAGLSGRPLMGRAARHGHVRLVERDEVLCVERASLSAVRQPQFGGLASGKPDPGQCQY